MLTTHSWVGQLFIIWAIICLQILCYLPRGKQLSFDYALIKIIRGRDFHSLVYVSARRF